VFGHLDGLEERLDSILCVSAANELARHTFKSERPEYALHHITRTRRWTSGCILVLATDRESERESERERERELTNWPCKQLNDRFAKLSSHRLCECSILKSETKE